jgi:hypothetical protein
LSLRYLAEMFLIRGFEFTHEAVSDEHPIGYRAITLQASR